MRVPRGIAALALALPPIAGFAVSCGTAPHDVGPHMAALTKAYASGNFSKVEFADTKTATVNKDYDRIAGDLIERFGAPKVLATKPTFIGDGADSGQSKLTWTWHLPTADWTYTSVVRLKKNDDQWRFLWDARSVWPKLTQDERLSATIVPQQRGDIMSTSGSTLVAARPVVAVGIDKVKVPAADARASARKLGRLLHINAKRFARRVKASGDKAFVQAIAVRKEKMTPKLAARIKKIKGASMLNQSLPLGPSKSFAAPLLGTVGPVTAEVMKDHPHTYSNGDLAGLSGLQGRYDDTLRGRPGVIVNVVDGTTGATMQKVYQAAPVDGRTLRVTLDESLQAGAEKLLAHIKPASALVAIRPSDGAVLAAANGPGTHGVNLATFGKAAPGSTFKTATSLALIRKGFGAGSEVNCPKHFVVDGKNFSNDSWYPKASLGTVTLSEAVAQSCNTAMVGQYAKVSGKDLADAAASLGFGVDRDAGFPAYFGQVPATGGKTEHAADMIGQGKVLASPLSMATAIASIQAGKTVVPQLVQGEQATATGVHQLTPQEASQLRSIFRQVVTSGTGRGLADLPGGPVIAKTGTAEFDKHGKRLTHTWMIAAQDDLAVAVYVDEGSTGSATSGPIVESFLRLAREK